MLFSSMRPSAPLRRVALAAALALTAAAPTARPAAAQSADDPAPLVFRIGTPVADTSVVVVIEQGGTRDTLRAELFRNQIGYVLDRNPGLDAYPDRMREVRRSSLEGYILQRLVDAEARRTPGLAADTAAVSAQIAGYEAQSGGPEAFAASLAENGLTPDSLRALLMTQALQGALVARWADAAPAPTAAAVAAYRLRMADEVTVRHIVWRYPSDPNAPDFDPAAYAAARAEAQAVLDSLKGGADFAAMAMRHGQDGTAPRGGLLDAFGRDAGLDEDFKTAAFALTTPGETTQELVETQFGWHAIHLDARSRGTLMPEDEARAALRRERQPEVIREKLRTLVAAPGVVIHVNPALLDADLNTPYTGD